MIITDLNGGTLELSKTKIMAAAQRTKAKAVVAKKKGKGGKR